MHPFKQCRWKHSIEPPDADLGFNKWFRWPNGGKNNGGFKVMQSFEKEESDDVVLNVTQLTITLWLLGRGKSLFQCSIFSFL